jgi:hypothetical protein
MQPEWVALHWLLLDLLEMQRNAKFFSIERKTWSVQRTVTCRFSWLFRHPQRKTSRFVEISTNAACAIAEAVTGWLAGLVGVLQLVNIAFCRDISDTDAYSISG